MTFGEAIREGWEIIKMNREAYRRAAARSEAFTWALVITALAGVASGLSPQNIGSVGFIWLPVVTIAGLFVGVAILHGLALLFGGRGDYMGLFRIVGLAELLGWASLVPVLGGLVGLWMIVVVAIALQEHHGLDAARSIIVVLIPALVVIVLGMIAGGALLGGVMLGGLLGGA
ncbi:MAG: hypothetical protein GF355_10075 [Candidatus Eisenbacteria bacterium]|nr:hypothetical protein [Candidatus Eisenbacteria bacterium]